MTDPSILITGASKGIGRALTDRLTSTGYQVVGIARKRRSDLSRRAD
jgi:3-oxoacyl-[acyl-carrier protein] reductase